MGKRSFEDVKKYVEWQSQGKCNVLSAKPEQHLMTWVLMSVFGMSKPILMVTGG